MSGRWSFRMGAESIREVENMPCVRPAGSFVVGWVDFEADKLFQPVEHRRFAIILLRSGRFMASRGSELRALPEACFSWLRLNCCPERT